MCLLFIRYEYKARIHCDFQSISWNKYFTIFSLCKLPRNVHDVYFVAFHETWKSILRIFPFVNTFLLSLLSCLINSFIISDVCKSSKEMFKKLEKANTKWLFAFYIKKFNDRLKQNYEAVLTVLILNYRRNSSLSLTISSANMLLKALVDMIFQAGLSPYVPFSFCYFNCSFFLENMHSIRSKFNTWFSLEFIFSYNSLWRFPYYIFCMNFMKSKPNVMKYELSCVLWNSLKEIFHSVSSPLEMWKDLPQFFSHWCKIPYILLKSIEIMSGF